MNVAYVVLNLIFVNKFVHSEACGKNPPFKYRIERYTRNQSKTSEYHISNVINNDKQGFYIELQEDIKYLCKGTLNITERCHHFWAVGRSIEVIEPGVFENQKLDSQLRLADNFIEAIKKGTFTNMEITDLELNSNRITVIEEGAFENLPNLSKIYLFNNKITEFNPDMIRNTPRMFLFSIERNNIKKLEENSLGFMDRTRPIAMFLDGNEIEEIHPNAFGNVTQFASLTISGNKLVSFPKELCEGHEYSTLIISNNKLTTLPTEFFKMTINQKVDLEENNFDCDTVKLMKIYHEISRSKEVEVKFNDTSKTIC